MELDPFAVRLCNIARLNRGLVPQPRIRLMEEAGVFIPDNKLDVDSICAVIERDPSLIDDWLAWSEDKRYGGPWLNRAATDMTLACAQFIIAEIGMFREIRQKKSGGPAVA